MFHRITPIAALATKPLGVVSFAYELVIIDNGDGLIPETGHGDIARSGFYSECRTVEHRLQVATFAIDVARSVEFLLVHIAERTKVQDFLVAAGYLIDLTVLVAGIMLNDDAARGIGVQAIDTVLQERGADGAVGFLAGDIGQILYHLIVLAVVGHCPALRCKASPAVQAVGVVGYQIPVNVLCATVEW